MFLFVVCWIHMVYKIQPHFNMIWLLLSKCGIVFVFTLSKKVDLLLQIGITSLSIFQIGYDNEFS
jgi:hypothetical protein